MSDFQVEDILPLSPLQEGFLFHALYDGEGTDVYISQQVFDIEGGLDVAALRSAARALLRRHGSLRAGFVQRRSGETAQFIQREVELPWTEVDLSGLGKAERDSELVRLTESDRVGRFDTAVPPLVRFTLIRLGEGRFRFLFTNHHIVLDGWSMPLLVNELFALYPRRGDETGLPKAAPYRDFLVWLSRQDRDAAKAAWARELAGLDEPTLMAPRAAGLRPALPRELHAELPESTTGRLAAQARRSGVTLSTVVQGVWGILLGRLLDRSDVVFGTTVSGRPAELPGVEHMIGLFINTLPVRVEIDPDEPFTGLAARVQEAQARMLAHQHVGLTDIHQATGFRNLFDTATVFENYPADTRALPGSATGAAADVRLVGTGGADATHYPLTLIAVPGPRLALRLDYRADLFDQAAAERLLAQVTGLFEAVAAAPHRPVRDLDALSPVERRRVLVEWNDTATPAPPITVPELVQERAVTAPDAGRGRSPSPTRS